MVNLRREAVAGCLIFMVWALMLGLCVAVWVVLIEAIARATAGW